MRGSEVQCRVELVGKEFELNANVMHAVTKGNNVMSGL